MLNPRQQALSWCVGKIEKASRQVFGGGKLKFGNLQQGFLLNPWFWLGLVLLLVLASFTGYQKGYNEAKAEHEAAATKTMTAMIEQHNELAEADRKAAIKAAEERHKQQIRRMEKKHELDMEAVRNHRAECNWSDDAVRLLNDIINDTNNHPKTTFERLPGDM